MSTTEAFAAAADAPVEGFSYRPVSTAAVASLVFGLLSTMVVFAARDSVQACLLLCPLPLVGVILGWRAMARMRAFPDQFTGGNLAVAGVAMSALCLVGGVALASVVYATEVPDGYVRTSFEELAPDEVEQRGDVLVPPDVQALDGKKVFIKGYMRPDSTPFKENINRFLLVRDNNQCCFGDLTAVKYFDQVMVEMKSSVVDYTSGVYRMGGTLRVSPENARNGRGAPVFALEADYAK